MLGPDREAVRSAHIAASLARVRAIAAGQGVTQHSLEAIKAEMLALAAQEHLFPFAEFPPPAAAETGARRYLLQSDPDGQFALYLNAMNPGNESKPHNHTTWAVIVAVEGSELNRLWERTDDGAVPGRASLREAGRVVVEPGQGVALLPDDIHSIHATGARPTRHLHLYGSALERLEGRLGFDPETGTLTRCHKPCMAPTAMPA